MPSRVIMLNERCKNCRYPAVNDSNTSTTSENGSTSISVVWDSLLSNIMPSKKEIVTTATAANKIDSSDRQQSQKQRRQREPINDDADNILYDDNRLNSDDNKKNWLDSDDNIDDYDNDSKALDYVKLSTIDTAIDKWLSFRYICGVFVNNHNVQSFIVLLTVVNAIMMGMATYGFVKSNPIVESKFELIDNIVLIIFSIELLLQFIFYGVYILKDGWLVFDVIVILLSWSFLQVQIIRSFRIFRTLRLITRVRAMKNIIEALFSVVPRMFAISGLLMIISYIFAVMFTEMFKDLYAEGYTGDVDYFGDLGDSLFTLFQMMTFDNFANMTREMMLAHKWAWIPVVAYVVVAGFVIVNLIIAVICDAVHMLQDTDKAKLRGKTVENTNDDRDKINDHHHITHIDNPKSTMSENSYDYSNDDNVGDQGNIANKHISLAQQFDMLENHIIELAKTQNQTKISVDALSLTSSNPM